jgi:hypothetical protein
MRDQKAKSRTRIGAPLPPVRFYLEATGLALVMGAALIAAAWSAIRWLLGRV